MSVFRPYERQVLESLLGHAMTDEALETLLEEAELVTLNHYRQTAYRLTVTHPDLPLHHQVFADELGTGDGVAFCGFVIFVENRELTLECYDLAFREGGFPDDVRDRQIELTDTTPAQLLMDHTPKSRRTRLIRRVVNAPRHWRSRWDTYRRDVYHRRIDRQLESDSPDIKEIESLLLGLRNLLWKLPFLYDEEKLIELANNERLSDEHRQQVGRLLGFRWGLNSKVHDSKLALLTEPARGAAKPHRPPKW